MKLQCYNIIETMEDKTMSALYDMIIYMKWDIKTASIK